MKKIFKTLAVLAAVAALGFGFVSCGDSGDDNNGSGSPSSGGGNGGASSKFVPETNIKTAFACPYSYQTYKSASEAIAAAENDEDVLFSEARINFYEDGTFIVYEYQCWYKKRNGKVEKDEESISPSRKGSYTLTGEFTEGTLNLVCSYNFYKNPYHPEPEYSKWLKDSLAVERTCVISGSKFECGNLVYNYTNIFTKQ